MFADGCPAGLHNVIQHQLQDRIKDLLARDARAAGVPFDTTAIPTSGPAFHSLLRAEQVGQTSANAADRV